MSHCRAIPLAVLSAALAVAADGGGVAGPITGFVLDGRANSLRAIEGLPGAARLGAPVRLPFAVAHAAVALRQDFALVLPASAASPVLARGLRSGAPEIAAIDGVMAPTSIALSVGGAAALLHSAATRRLQFIDGLPGAPHAREPIAAPGDLAAVALAPTGAVALLADSEGQIWRASSSAQSLVPIARLRGAVSLSFLPDRDAALAASDSGDVLLLEGLSGAISIRTVSTIPGARSVQALDSTAAGVITADGRLASIRLDTGATEWIPLAAAAEAFDSLDRSLYVLNRAGDRPLLLLDAARGRSAWFVPPEPAPTLAPEHRLARGPDRPNQEL